MSLIEKLMAAAMLAPKIVALIIDLEKIFPFPNFGPQKLAMVKAFFEAVASDLMDLWPRVEEWIEKLVAIFNETGVFKKKGDT